MKPESRALGQALLDHHLQVTKQHPPGKKSSRRSKQSATASSAAGPASLTCSLS